MTREDAYYEKISDPLENIFFYSARREYSLETILVQARLLEKAMDIDDSDGAVACIEKMFEIYVFLEYLLACKGYLW